MKMEERLDSSTKCGWDCSIRIKYGIIHNICSEQGWEVSKVSRGGDKFNF
jgi:hypothetical protein